MPSGVREHGRYFFGVETASGNEAIRHWALIAIRLVQIKVRRGWIQRSHSGWQLGAELINLSRLGVEMCESYQLRFGGVRSLRKKSYARRLAPKGAIDLTELWYG